MLRLGVVLVFFGLGSALLHAMGFYFKLLKWAGPMQPVFGLSIGGLGIVIVLIKVLTGKNEPAEQGQAGAPQQFGPPPSGPQSFGPPQGPPPFGAQSSGPHPQQYGPGPQSFGPPSGPQPVQQQFGPQQGFAPQGQPPFGAPPYGPQGGQQFGPRG